MSERSPPFTALRAVEAASRHRSFTSAARELQITHSAVSQSIRRLEADLGTRLFERKGGAMEPSSAAMRLAQTYSEAQEALSKAMREIIAPHAAASLSVAMPAAFGRAWFASKIGRLNQTLPDVDVQIRTRDDDQDADILLEWARKAVKGHLGELVLLPLCSPDLAARLGGPDPRTIIRSPLIADADSSWSVWAARWLPEASAPRAHAFDDAGMALEAAVQGGGIVLSNVFAAESYLTSGRLVALGFEVPAEAWLVAKTRPTLAAADAVERFMLWLRLEIRRSLAATPAKGERADPPQR